MMENQSASVSKFCTNRTALFLTLGSLTVYLVSLYTYRTQVPESVNVRPPAVCKPSLEPEPTLATESNRPCTFALLRKYYASHHYLPGEGVMVDIDSKTPYYQPSFCKFQHRRMQIDDFSKCLVRGNIRSIMTIGDSNAGKHFQHFRKYMTRCKRTAYEKVKEKGFLPDADYYKGFGLTDENWLQFIEVHYRFCSGCAGERYVCVLSRASSENLLMEHLPMTLVMDDSIQFHIPKYGIAVHTMDKVWALTSQEFIFRYFLQDRYPDVFFVFLPFNHAKHQLSERLRIDIKYFQSLVKFYFPPTTKIIYMPAFSEFERNRKSQQWVNATFEKMLATDKIDKLNQVMFKALESDLLNSTSNTFSFLDMVTISRPLGRWAVDGVHMQNVWYEMVTSMLLETLCNSIKLNAF